MKMIPIDSKGLNIWFPVGGTIVPRDCLGSSRRRGLVGRGMAVVVGLENSKAIGHAHCTLVFYLFLASVAMPLFYYHGL